MTSHGVAWLIAAISALLLSIVLVVILRIEGGKRFWVVAFIFVTALAPYRFDGEHYAPAIIVGLFRVLFEDHPYANRPWVLLVGLWFIMVGCYLMVAAMRTLLRGRFRFRRLPTEGKKRLE